MTEDAPAFDRTRQIPENANAPRKANMSACEVLYWIAYRGEPPKPHPLDEIFPMLGPNQRETLLEGLVARSDSCPSLMVHKQVVGMGLTGPLYGFRAVEASSPGQLRALRARMRRRLGRLITFPQLTEMFREKIAADVDETARIDQAHQELLEAARADILTVYARRDRAPSREDHKAMHQAVPLTDFMNKRIQITILNTIDMDDEGFDFKDYEGATYRDACCLTAQVLNIWHPRVDSDVAAMNQTSDHAPIESDFTRDASPEKRAEIWMHAYFRGWMDSERAYSPHRKATPSATGRHRPKRDPTIKLCSAAVNVTSRIALKAWNSLPASWKAHTRKSKD